MRRLFWFALLAGCGDGIKHTVLPGLGDSCADDPCQSGLTCGHDGTCVADGDLGSTADGDDCSASLECSYGLVCTSENLCAPEGSAGTGAAGDTCSSDNDCQAGHFCDDDGTCTDIGIPFWEGGTCPDDDYEGEFRVLFEVPNLPASGEIDFYSLPFPNDTRLDTTGRPDLSGFPDPGADAQVASLVSAIEAGPAGWGLNPTVYFRLSHAHDISSVKADGADPTVRWASIDEDAPDYGDLTSLQYFTRNTRGKYICQNWVGVSVYDGRPLEEGHTYAVWLTKGIQDKDGVNAVRDNGFKVVMQEDRPSDLTLARAWDDYAPFRDYLTREGIDASNIAGAAVFTTGYPSRGTRYFREVTEGDDVSVAVSDLTACGGGESSPCDDGGARACGDAGRGFTEIHGHISTPDYRGADGGVTFDASTLRPTIQDTEQVCFAMTVPDGEMPAAGWPVVVYAPDVGGTFRDAVSSGLAEKLAAQGIATVAMELPGHGERAGGYVDTSDLTAWLGAQLQASADPNLLVRFAQEWSADAADSPTGAPIAFDPADLWFAGTGEGASVGVNFLAWTPDVRGAVLGNPSGYGVHRFADEDSPVDIEHGLMAAFADSALTRWHPMLNLLEQYFELADPVNDGYGVVRDSPTESKHLLVIHGVEDEDTPAAALHSELRALSIPTAGTVLDDYGQSTTTFPVFENTSTDDGRRTAASVQVSGGRAALLDAENATRAAAFVASGLGGGSPTIEE